MYCYKCKEVTAHIELRERWGTTLENEIEREKVETR
jgi:hypothetical protein